jgi:hypothetical protein
MKTLLEKLNYKGQKRIAVLNAVNNFRLSPLKELKDVLIDNEIDMRYPYDFMIVFVRKVSEVEKIAPVALHNLVADGVLWFCYPKRSPEMAIAEIDREHGWEALNEADFFGTIVVNIDDEWSALRFRNKKHLKAASGKDKVKKH